MSYANRKQTYYIVHNNNNLRFFGLPLSRSRRSPALRLAALRPGQRAADSQRPMRLHQQLPASAQHRMGANHECGRWQFAGEQSGVPDLPQEHWTNTKLSGPCARSRF